MKILVTGACGGIGRALAEHLDGAGHDLLLLDIDPLALEKLDDELAGNHTLVPFNLWSAGADDYLRLARLIEEDHGHLDALIHVAAYCGNLRPIVQIEPENWLKALQTNVTAPLWLSQTLLPLLRAGEGRILFTRFPDHTRQSAYWHGFGVSQAALDALVQALYDERGGYPEIGIATVSPPWVDTHLSRTIFPDGQPDWRYPEDIVHLYTQALAAPKNQLTDYL
ncbi:MAG: SDR family NAD(P)-dependent oxidoreductase [Cardiobacteriaceae bacterium]|nr:SDR family NAD(P)-dependent oxidoreductase [Cardiobacteriaceae bacterium]